MAAVLKKAGMQTYSYNMIGLPFEDMRGIFDTIKMNGSVMPDLMQVTIFYPYFKTRLYDVCLEKAFLTERVLSRQWIQFCLLQLFYGLRFVKRLVSP